MSGMNRREFIGRAVAAVGATVAGGLTGQGSRAVAEQTATPRAGSAILRAGDTVILGRTGIQTSRLAIGTGTDVAIEASDITLINGSLIGVVTAIQISRATMRNVYQNLFGAFIYNTAGLPIALGVLYPFFGILLSPLLAALAMSFSSVTVISNANRLKSWKPKN